MKARLFSFLEELRGSDEARKRRWAFGLSAVSMTAVAAFWLVMLNVNPGAVPSAAEQAEETRVGTFLGIFRAGSAVLWRNIASAIGREREVEILRQEFTFIPKDTPAAPVHELPVSPANR